MRCMSARVASAFANPNSSGSLLPARLTPLPPVQIGGAGEPDALAAALTDTLRATRAKDPTNLASALRTLALVAERLATALED